MKTLTKLTLTALAVAFATSSLMAQDENRGVVRRQARDTEHSAQSGPQVTQRMQAFYDDSDNTIGDADRQYMKVIYRELDLDKDKNAALYFPEDIVDGQENFFRIIMRLLANNQIAAYEYLDGREVFTDEYRLKVRDLLDRFHIIYSDAKGSTEKNPRFTINESDVPTNEVLSYYIIEKWEFDTRNNRLKPTVEAVCPVLHRSGDFGGEAVRYPMFWVKFSDLRPWLTQQTIFTNDDNNLPTCTYDDFFNLTMYDGEIYKTRNLKNKSMMQLYPDADKLQAAQDSIQQHLDNFEKKLWVPNREEVLAAKAKKSEVAAKSDAASVDEASSATVEEPKSAKRSTRRASKPKETKVKETKASTSSSATRSVRRRR